MKLFAQFILRPVMAEAWLLDDKEVVGSFPAPDGFDFIRCKIVHFSLLFRNSNERRKVHLTLKRMLGSNSIGW